MKEGGNEKIDDRRDVRLAGGPCSTQTRADGAVGADAVASLVTFHLLEAPAATATSVDCDSLPRKRLVFFNLSVIVSAASSRKFLMGLEYRNSPDFAAPFWTAGWPQARPGS